LTTSLGNSVKHSLIAYAQVGAGAAPAEPEPATWARMLLGIGAIGFSMRKRRVVEPSVDFSFG
jgi:hypothetical protein